MLSRFLATNKVDKSLNLVKAGPGAASTASPPEAGRKDLRRVSSTADSVSVAAAVRKGARVWSGLVALALCAILLPSTSSFNQKPHFTSARPVLRFTMPAFLVPSQVVQTQPKLAATPPANSHETGLSSEKSAVTAESSLKSSNRSRRRRRKRNGETYDPKSSAEDRSAATLTRVEEEQLKMAKKKQPQAKQKQNVGKRNQIDTHADASQNPQGKTAKKKYPPLSQLTGNLPDIFWRSIPMEHLRLHPNFVPLPERITTPLETLEDVRNFRQDSWQWDALHAGRCTTSQAAAALGFLEPKASKVLDVPSSWRQSSKGASAYYRLRAPALRTLEDMNENLVEKEDEEDDEGGDEIVEIGSSDPVWVVPQNDFPFPAKYRVQMTQKERSKRKKHAQRFNSTDRGGSIRMHWGNAQEATSILTALNYFCSKNPGMVVKEVGMCGAGISSNETDGGLLIGASPDGVLCYPNGTMEALEVKNHCPFSISSYNPRVRGGSSSKRFCVRGMSFDPERNSGVMPQYIPQLMLEMVCLGPSCTSAIMVRQTATHGALVLRIHRDEEWINEMMYWLNRFYNEFVMAKNPPPADFFFQGDSESARYRKFLDHTKRVQANVQIVDRIPNKAIQRVMGENDLFLD